MTGATACTQLDGTVARANERGVLLDGETAWHNISKWANPTPEVPAEGALVRVGLDAAGFVRSIKVLAMPLVDLHAASQPEGRGPDTRERHILREAVLNTAVAILSSQGAVDPDHVFELAAKLEAWVLC